MSARHLLVEYGDTRLKPDVWSRIGIDQFSGCWIWTGGQTPNGYGKYCGTVAHLAIYRKLIGRAPEGLTANHNCHDPRKCRGGNTCRHRLCVNPAHLEFITQKEQLDPERRNRWGRLDETDVCKYNHPFTPENTSWQLSRGVKVRRCKACARETARRWQATKRGNDPGKFEPRMHDEPRKKPPLATHCSKGHPYTPRNTYYRPDGKGRECCTCFGRCPNEPPKSWMDR